MLVYVYLENFQNNRNTVEYIGGAIVNIPGLVNTMPQDNSGNIEFLEEDLI